MIQSTGADANTREVFVTPRFAGFAELDLPPIKALQKRVGSRYVYQSIISPHTDTRRQMGFRMNAIFAADQAHCEYMYHRIA